MKRGRMIAGIRAVTIGWLVAAICLLASTAYAMVTPGINASMVGNYGRIMFQWPQPVQLQTSTNGNRLTVQFSEPVAINPSVITEPLESLITAASLSDDGRELILTMTGNYRVRSFISNRTAGIDIMRPASASLTPIRDRQQPSTARVNEVESADLTPPGGAGARTVINDIYASTAQQAENVVVRSTVMGNTAKLIFEWPSSVSYRAFQRSDRLLIEFNRSAPSLPPTMDSELRRFITTLSSRTLGGHLIYTLTFPESVNVSHRKEGTFVVVDLVRSDAAVSRKAEVTPIARPPQSPSVPPAPATPAERRAPPASAPSSQPVVAGRDARFPIPAAKPNVPDRRFQSAEQELAAPVADVAVADQRAPTIVSSNNKVALRPSLNVSEDGVELVFDWPVPVNAVAFSRNGTGWIAFDRPSRLSLLDLNRANDLVGQFQSIPHEQYTILRFSNPENMAMQARRSENEWRFLLREQPQTRPIRVELRSESSAATHLFIPMTHYGDPVIVTDPDIGDRLVMVPVGKAGFGMRPRRQFIEATLPQTDQGVVVIPASDEITVQPLRSGVRIISPYGLQISPNLPMPEAVIFDDYLETGTFFPADRWKTSEDSDFFTLRSALLQDMAAQLREDPPSAEQIRAANAFRLRLAQLYMAEDLYMEALSQLERIEQTDPVFALQRRVPALRGMALFMRDRYQEAHDAFNHTELSDFAETALWQKLMRIAKGEWKPRLKLDKAESGFIQRYSPAMRRKLAFLLAEKYIEDRNHTRAISTIDRLRTDGLLDGHEELAQYYFGLIGEKNRRIRQAVEMWVPLMTRFDNPYVRARATLDLTEMQFQQEMIDEEEAISRLERIRYAWRGDGLEQDILRVLGQLYVDAGRTVDGLRTWRELVTLFPESEAGQKVARLMTDVFIDLFNRGGADNLSPLEALTLYYEFRELTPLGDEGDIMIQGLADRLVEVDLLQRAAGLLTHQVRYRLAGEDQSRVGARLATIHLMNLRPDLAIEVLQNTYARDISPTLRQTRLHLLAQGLQQVGEYDKALAVLEGDATPEGRQLTLETLWQKQGWPQTVNYLTRLLQGTDTSQAVTDQQAEYILKLALAQQFDGDSSALQATRMRFLPMMQDSEYAESFDFLTTAFNDINHTTLSRVESVIARFDGFMDTFRQQIKEEGLSTAIE